MFSLIQRNVLRQGEREVQVFEPEFTELQEEVLRLLGVPEASYRGGR